MGIKKKENGSVYGEFKNTNGKTYKFSFESCKNAKFKLDKYYDESYKFCSNSGKKTSIELLINGDCIHNGVKINKKMNISFFEPIKHINHFCSFDDDRQKYMYVSSIYTGDKPIMFMFVYFNPNLTTDNYYFQYHIGIHRPLTYNVYKNNKDLFEFVGEPAMSMDLQTFSVMAVSYLFPKCNNRFLIVTPLDTMKDILVKYFNNLKIPVYNVSDETVPPNVNIIINRQNEKNIIFNLPFINGDHEIVGVLEGYSIAVPIKEWERKVLKVF